MAGIVIGAILMVIAVIVVLYRQLSTSKVYSQMLAAEKQKIGDVLAAYTETKKELGELGAENTVAEMMTVMGSIECDTPLTSPYGNIPCIYYLATVTAKRTEYYYEKDGNGNSVRRSRQVTEILDRSENSVEFRVNDGTGSVLVRPEKADVRNAKMTVNRSEVFTDMGQSSISIGRFQIGLGTGSRPETLKYEESVIGLDGRVTVIGTLCDKMGDFAIEKNGKSALIISTKSADELVSETKSTLKHQKIGTIVLVAIGVVCLVLGIILK